MKKLTHNLTIALLGIALLSGALSSCERNNPSPEDPTTVTDIDGNVYNVVRIGTQLWTVENLRTTRYNDGTTIPTGLSNTAWAATTTGAYSIYDDDASNDAIYGKLYNFYAVNTNILAPKGWHVPSKAEWDLLTSYLGGSGLAGGKMKSTSSLWLAPNKDATNTSKFSALPSGWRASGGGYSLLGASAYWWSTLARPGEYVRVDNDLAGIAGNAANQTFGYAVRCVRD